jgi:hypothetical protein
MANQLKIKRGVKASIPTLAAGELAFCTDTFELFGGTGSANKYLGGGAGAWPISITGNASTATTANNVLGLTINNSGIPINPNNVTQNQIGYNNSVSLFGQTDGGLYSSAYSSSWVHQIFGDFRSGQIAIRGKNNGIWQSWRTVIDSGNIGSQSVSYASTAGSAPANGGTSAACSGNAATATKLATARTIGGVSFDGSANITVASATGGFTVTGALTATGNITAYYSDDRLKTKLGNIKDALQKVCSLNGFHYHANELAQSLGYEPVPEVGLSAQQVKAVLPEAIAPAPIDNKYMTVKYDHVIPLLVEAIKELQGEIFKLKKRSARLHA